MLYRFDDNTVLTQPVNDRLHVGSRGRGQLQLAAAIRKLQRLSTGYLRKPPGRRRLDHDLMPQAFVRQFGNRALFQDFTVVKNCHTLADHLQLAQQMAIDKDRLALVL